MSSRSISLSSFLGFGFGLTALVLIGFAILRWLGVPAGSLIDWVIGIASFWWMLVIVTIPWNIHFEARAVVGEASESQRRGLHVDPEQIAYARAWIGRSLLLAVGLHLFSAGALYALAASGVSRIGYISSAAALLLTGLRPAVRGYEFVAARLRAIGEAARYPREDVTRLRGELDELAGRLRTVEERLDVERPGSWAALQQARLAEQEQRLQALRLAQDELRASNAAEHARLAREAEQAVARITADGQVLDNVRELIRFFKSA